MEEWFNEVIGLPAAVPPQGTDGLDGSPFETRPVAKPCRTDSNSTDSNKSKRTIHFTKVEIQCSLPPQCVSLFSELAISLDTFIAWSAIVLLESRPLRA